MNTSAFSRKIIYIAIIAALLIPLSLISRPATRDGNNDVQDAGGQLSYLRDKHNLSQAKLMEIDPTSETMKLASLGLRGVAVNMLWMQAIEHKKKENWDQMASTLNALIKIQPNFIKVWEYQAHNLSYNISMEFDDYEYRYHWVKRGIKFLKEGIPYNYTDHRMTDNLGFFTGMKIGRSDEKSQFRRMFRSDTEFHEHMSDYVEPGLYDTREYGFDNWKMAYHWYDRSLNLVEEQSAAQYTGDMLFFQKKPAQLRNQAVGLQDEYRMNEIIQEIWRAASEEWNSYGNRSLADTKGISVTIEGLSEQQNELEEKRAVLDQLIPGARERLIKELQEIHGISDEELAVIKIPADQRNDDENQLAQRINAQLFRLDPDIDKRVLRSASKENAMSARRALDDVLRVLAQIRTIDNHQHTTNYRYWKIRTQAEATKKAMQAHQLLFDAGELRRKSIFDDEYEIDSDGNRKILKRGAISKYNESFELWRQVLEEFPRLDDGQLALTLVSSLIEYQEMLSIAGMEWPADCPLQDFIDTRAKRSEPDDLPTSEDIAERLSLTEDGDGNEDEDDVNGESKDDTAPSSDAEKAKTNEDAAAKDAEAKPDGEESGEANEGAKDEGAKDEGAKDEGAKDEDEDADDR